MKTIKLLAKNLADSPILDRGAKLWEINQKNAIHLTKLDKLITGVYQILKDYSDDKFPPKYQQRQSTYQNEIDFADRHINDQFTSIKPFVYENPSYYQHFFDF